MWTSPSGKHYIGQSINLEKRHYEFLATIDSYAGSKLRCARKKYPNNEQWEYRILEHCKIDKLDEREQFYISFYDTVNNGYNCTIGGNSRKGYKPTKETINKLRESHLKYFVENPNASKIHSQKLKEFYKSNPKRLKELGDKRKEFYKTHTIWNKGMKMTEEQNKANSERKKEYYKTHSSPMKGKHHTKETKLKLSRKVIQLTLDGDFIKEYESCKDAGKAVGVCVSCISAAAKGKQKTSGGFKWMYSDEYNSTILLNS